MIIGPARDQLGTRPLVADQGLVAILWDHMGPHPWESNSVYIGRAAGFIQGREARNCPIRLVPMPE